MKELTLTEVRLVAALLKQCVPDLREVYIFGSAAVAAIHPEISGALRRSVDIDMAPKDKPVYTSDSRIVEAKAGQDSEFYDREGYFLDYVPAELLRVTPPGWRERALKQEIAPQLVGHFLSPADIAYNKLWVGRSKDLSYVRDLIGVGLVTLSELKSLHASNQSIPPEDRRKVDDSIGKLLLP